MDTLRHKVTTCCSLKNEQYCSFFLLLKNTVFSIENHYQNDVEMYKAMIAVVPTYCINWALVYLHHSPDHMNTIFLSICYNLFILKWYLQISAI